MLSSTLLSRPVLQTLLHKPSFAFVRKKTQTNDTTDFFSSPPLIPKLTPSMCPQRLSGLLKSPPTTKSDRWNSAFLSVAICLCTKLSCKQCCLLVAQPVNFHCRQIAASGGVCAYWETRANYFFWQRRRRDAYKKVASRPERRSADLDSPRLGMNSLLLLALLGCLGKCAIIF